MPIYEYECTKCSHRFEVIQKVSDSPRKKCEKCGAKAERLISSPAIQFKGTGWYVTDYARKGSAGQDGKEKDRDAKSSSDSDKDTKSAKKSSGKNKEKAGTTGS